MSKIHDKVIASAVGIVFIFGIFLVSSFFNTLSTKEYHDTDIHKSKIDIAVIQTNLKHLKKGQEDIKVLIRNLK